MQLYDDQVMQEIGELLIDAKQSVAVAESVTSGAIQLAMSTIKSASRFYQGGMTAYNIAQKFHHLKVEPIHAMEVNCVSDQVARQMSLSVASMFSADWGVAITGYAVPVPESDDDVFAHFAISFNGKVVDSGRINPSKDDTMNLQLFYTNEVCRSLVKAIRHEGQTQS
jgi:nicotinamide-nucleotide amidase